jgi:hypothetical protein
MDYFLVAVSDLPHTVQRQPVGAPLEVPVELKTRFPAPYLWSWKSFLQKH